MTNTSQVERQHSALGSLATTFTTTTATTTATTATTPSISTLTAHTDFNAGLSPSSMMVDGYRVHPSALATSPAGNMTAVAAAQHAATLAANDVENTRNIQGNGSGVIDNPSSSKSSSGIVQKTLQRSMPLGLAVLMGYIFYIYTFHVCIDYILHTQHRPIQAGIYLGVGSTVSLLFFISYIRCIFRGPGSALKPPQKTPPPPIPITTTKYQPRKIQRSVSHQSGSLHTPPTDTTPLLQSTPAVSGSSSFQYQTTSQYSHFSDTKTQSVPDQKREHRDKGHAPAGDDCDGIRINIESDTQCEGDRPENIPIATLSISKRNGTPRWCDICKIYKPDRCHHCSECDECVLRMDHHCPWVRGCIGYNNHKFFYLFIFYTSVMSVWVVATMIPLLVEVVHKCQPDITLLEITKPRKQPPQCTFDNQWTILVVVSLILALFIVSFTLAHTIHILKNQTTIESLLDMRPTFIKLQYTRTGLPPHWPESGFSVIKLNPGDNLWDQGSRSANWKSIMGPSWWLWFVPYDNTQGDGIHEVYSDKIYEKLLGQAMTRIDLERSSYEARTQTAVPKLPTDLLAVQESNAAFDGVGSSNSTLVPGRIENQRSGSSRNSSLINSSRGVTESREHRVMAAETNGTLGTQEWAMSRNSEDSVGSMGRSLPTPRSSPRLDPTE